MFSSHDCLICFTFRALPRGFRVLKYSLGFSLVLVKRWSSCDEKWTGFLSWKDVWHSFRVLRSEQSSKHVAKVCCKLGRSQKGYLRKWVSDNGPRSFFDHKKWQGDLNSDKPVPLQGIDVLILEWGSGYESIADPYSGSLCISKSTSSRRIGDVIDLDATKERRHRFGQSTHGKCTLLSLLAYSGLGVRVGVVCVQDLGVGKMKVGDRRCMFELKQWCLWSVITRVFVNSASLLWGCSPSSHPV